MLKKENSIMNYCGTGNFRLEYIFTIFVRQASLAKFNVYRTFCDVIRYAAIHTKAMCWTAEKRNNSSNETSFPLK